VQFEFDVEGTMQLELSRDEMALLRKSLDRLADELERELVRTDKADLQHAANRELETLVMIRDRLVASAKK
jgi:hypothetical protein